MYAEFNKPGAPVLLLPLNIKIVTFVKTLYVGVFQICPSIVLHEQKSAVGFHRTVATDLHSIIVDIS